jgi:hypothetical protein
VRLLFLFLVFPLPILLIGAAYATQAPTLPIVAFAVQYLGCCSSAGTSSPRPGIRRISIINQSLREYAKQRIPIVVVVAIDEAIQSLDHRSGQCPVVAHWRSRL